MVPVGQLAEQLAFDGLPEPEPEPAPRSRARRPVEPGAPRYTAYRGAESCAVCSADQHAAATAGRYVPLRQRARWQRETATGGRTLLCPPHKQDREVADAEEVRQLRAAGGVR